MKTKTKTNNKRPANGGRSKNHTVMCVRSADYDTIAGIAVGRYMSKASALAAVLRGWNCLDKAQQDAVFVRRK